MVSKKFRISYWDIFATFYIIIYYKNLFSWQFFSTITFFLFLHIFVVEFNIFKGGGCRLCHFHFICTVINSILFVLNFIKNFYRVFQVKAFFRLQMFSCKTKLISMININLKTERILFPKFSECCQFAKKKKRIFCGLLQ